MWMHVFNIILGGTRTPMRRQIFLITTLTVGIVPDITYLWVGRSSRKMFVFLHISKCRQERAHNIRQHKKTARY